MQFNTVFTGKNYIELDSVDSTNNYAANLINTTKVPDGTVIMAHYQFSGRGQKGNEWHSNPSENLMCSIIYKTNLLAAKDVFMISKITSLAVKETLDFLLAKDTLIKWPNDIYVEDKKICGMLIENQWQGNQLTSIIGIGLNINQTNFPDQPRATSCALVIGKTLDIKNVLQLLVQNLEKMYLKIRANKLSDISENYKSGLMFINNSRTFKTQNEIFQGAITDVKESGHLEIKRTDGSLVLFAFKEVEFVF
jgi:BirA family biotin operon repressor/biotin-[acetyl-CoA-carboxylase] ligase